MSSLYGKPRQTWVEAVAFGNGLWLHVAHRRQPYKGQHRLHQVVQAYGGRSELFHLKQGCGERRQISWLHRKLHQSWVEAMAFMNSLRLAHHFAPHKDHYCPPHEVTAIRQTKMHVHVHAPLSGVL